jgi:DnaJ-class molecular chaperone
MSYAEMQARLDDCAYARDIRNRSPEPTTVTMPDGLEVQLPTHKEVCPACRGEGHTVNPSIDCNGLSAEDFAEDPDFAEDYMGGRYDVQCGHCRGLRVIDVVDWKRVPRKVRAQHRRQMLAERQAFEEHLGELRAGC